MQWESLSVVLCPFPVVQLVGYTGVLCVKAVVSGSWRAGWCKVVNSNSLARVKVIQN